MIDEKDVPEKKDAPDEKQSPEQEQPEPKGKRQRLEPESRVPGLDAPDTKKPEGTVLERLRRDKPAGTRHQLAPRP